jgi:hypothetical protein
MQYKFLFTTYDVKETLMAMGAGWLHYTKKVHDNEIGEETELDKITEELNAMVEKENWRVRNFTATPGTDKEGVEKVIYTILLEREAPEPEKTDNMPNPTT